MMIFHCRFHISTFYVMMITILCLRNSLYRLRRRKGLYQWSWYNIYENITELSSFQNHNQLTKILRLALCRGNHASLHILSLTYICRLTAILCRSIFGLQFSIEMKMACFNDSSGRMAALKRIFTPSSVINIIVALKVEAQFDTMR